MNSGLNEVRRWFRSPWVIAGVLLQVVAFPLANGWAEASLTVDGSPDNLSKNLYSWVGIIAVMLTAGFLCYLRALLKLRRQYRGPNEASHGTALPRRP